MKKPLAQRCADCIHARFELTPTTRRPVRDWAGACAFVVAEPITPFCVTIAATRKAIWPNDGATCRVFQRKEAKS